MCVKNGAYRPNFRVVLAPNRAKIGQYIGFRLYSWKVSTGFTRNWVYKPVGATFIGVYKIGPRDKIFGHFWPPNVSRKQIFDCFHKCFLWIHISLALYAYWRYFQRCVQYGPQRPNFWVILDPKLSQNCGLWSLSQKCSIIFTSVLIHMLITSTFGGVWSMGIRGPILGPFWAPK